MLNYEKKEEKKEIMAEIYVKVTYDVSSNDKRYINNIKF